MDKETINVLIEKMNNKCQVSNVPAVFSYNENVNSFECESELIPDQMLLICTKGLSEKNVKQWFERTVKFVMDKKN